MRIDKYLKVSRIIKRRSVADNACDAGRVLINDRVAKSGNKVKIGDILTVRFGTKTIKIKVLYIDEKATKDKASEMYEIIEG